MKRFWIFFSIFYLAWLVRATLFYSAVDQSITSDTWRLVFGNLVKFGMWVLPAAWMLHREGRTDLLAAFKLSTRPRRLRSALLVSLLYFVMVYTLEPFISGRTLSPLLSATPALMLVTLAKVFVSPISEELLFRGFVLPKLNERNPFWIANLIQALLFTAMHWPNWLWVNGFQTWILTTSLGVFIIALLLGWLVQRTGSIWPPVAVHIVNNFLSSFVG